MIAPTSVFHRREGLALGTVSALLLWISFFPLDFGWCTWVAIVPLLVALRRGTVGAKRIATCVAAFGFYIPALSWMRVADDTMVTGWACLTIFCAFFFWLTVRLITRIDARTSLPFALTVPLVWTAVEYLRGQLFGGFAWYFLAHAHHDNGMLIQVADLGGELTVTFLVAAVNGLLADILTRPISTFRRSAFAVGFLVAASLSYGSWRLSQTQFAVGPKVALLQGNISQDLKNGVFSKGFDAGVKFIQDHYFRLAEKAQRERPDLIVWPETSLPVELLFLTPGASENSIKLAQKMAIDDTAKDIARMGQYWKTATLIGVNTKELGPGDAESRFNSAVLVDGQGTYRGRYDKVHRVPFGEFVPFREQMPWLQKLTPYEGYDYSLTAGRGYPRLPVESNGKEFHFGVLICYEDSDANLTRQYVSGNQQPVDFLVNITNDGWFKGSSEHDEHLAVSRFRAVECRRSLVRCVNMGISAVIDPNGQVTHLPAATWAESKCVDEIVVANVPIDHRTSVYARYGDWLPWGCGIVVLILFFWRRRPA